MTNRALKIINHYGVLKQLKYFQSEIFEFNEAVINFENGVGDIKNIIEEMADIRVMLLEFFMYYDIKNEEITEVMNFKLNRQIERIKNENE